VELYANYIASLSGLGMSLQKCLVLLSQSVILDKGIEEGWRSLFGSNIKYSVMDGVITSKVREFLHAHAADMQ
jgi:hypothetical protein